MRAITLNEDVLYPDHKFKFHSIITKHEVSFIHLYKNNGRAHKRPLKAVTFNVGGGG